MVDGVRRDAGLFMVTAFTAGIGACTTDRLASEELPEQSEDAYEPRSMMPPPRATDCEGDALPACPAGWTGPACDLACDAEDCDYALYCHGDGRTYGLATFGARLFHAEPTWTAGRVREALERFVIANPARLGVPTGVRREDLDLTPARRFRDDAGGLTIVRLRQRYRGFPVFGADGTVTLSLTSRGAIAMSGSIVDGRRRFEHVDRQATREQAIAAILAHAAAHSGTPAVELEAATPRLVAVPRAQSIAWAADVRHGAARVATVVVAADPEAEELPLLLVTGEAHAALANEVSVEVFAEDRGSNIVVLPFESVLHSTLYEGSPLVGSTFGTETRLATERVVAYDVSGAASFVDLDLVSPHGGPDALFDEPDPSIAFDVQQAYLKTSSPYAWIQPFMAGHWDSLRGDDSPTEPSDFMPRVIVWVRPTYPMPGATRVNIVTASQVPEPQLPEEYEQPLGGPDFEDLGYIYFTSSLSLTADTSAHEFGHVLDLFTGLAFVTDGLGCSGPACSPSCVEDTTDEAGSLVETIGHLSSVWFLTHLYERPADDCSALMVVSGSDDDEPHNEACRAAGEPFDVFLRDDDPECPGPDLCDKPDAPDEAPVVNGLCSDDQGYDTVSWNQAFWEIGHGEVCAPDPPYTCEPLDLPPGVSAADALTPALLYALRVDARSYGQFADAFMTYVACNYDPSDYQLYSQVQNVFCHHRLRDCDAGIPASCEDCGNSVQEGSEMCDGNDLGGETCVSQGYSDGILGCASNCQAFDVNMCDAGLDTTAGTTTAPGTGTGSSSGSEPAESSSGATMDTGTDGADGGGGCGCRAAPPRSNIALGVLLAAIAVRRRGRRARGATLAIAAVMAGCGPCRGDEASDCSDAMGETQSSSAGSSGETQASSGSSETGERFPGWAIGDFSTEGDRVGTPFDPILSAWISMTIRPDGRVTERLHNCADDVTEHEFMWSLRSEEDVLDLIPIDQPSDVFQWGIDQVTGLEIHRGGSCDSLTVRRIFAETGMSASGELYRGRVCVEGEATPDGCIADRVWCDGEPPPPCE